MAKQAKGPRVKHVPQRTCVACRRTDAKRGLVRVVRLPEGRVAVDPTGKQAGRGAYVCAEQACWEAALKRHALERALKIERLHPDDEQTLLAYAATLVSHSAFVVDDRGNVTFVPDAVSEGGIEQATHKT